MVPHIEWFELSSLRPLDPPRPIGFGDDSEVFAIAIRTIVLTTKTTNVRLTNVLLVPDFVVSLISVSKLAEHGLTLSFVFGTAKVIKDRKVVLCAVQKGGVYCLTAKPVTFTPESAHTVVDVNIMHQRFGHLNFQSLTKMVNKGQVKGVEGLSGKPEFCEPCHLGKHKRLSLKTLRQRATRPFQLIHCDIGGPVTPASRSGSIYWITFICDYLEHPWIYFLKRKSEAQEKYNKFITDARDYYKSEVGSFAFSMNFVNFFRTDGAPELGSGDTGSDKFKEQLRAEGTFHEVSAADTQSQNGVAERMNQTMCYNTMAMLIESKLPKSFWTEAMQTATFLIAHRPSSSNGGESPWTRMTGRRVDPTLWKPFGCPAYAHIFKAQHNGKFGNKAHKSIMLGYAPNMKAYRLFNVHTRKVFSSRHVTFNENGTIDASIFPPSDGEDDPTHEQWEGLLRDHKIHELHDPGHPNIESSGGRDDNDSDDSDDDDTVVPPPLPTPSTYTAADPRDSISTRPGRTSMSRASRIP